MSIWEAYAVHPAVLAGTGLLLVALVGLGILPARSRRRARGRVGGWSLVLLAFALAAWVSADSGPGARLLILVAAVLVALKSVVAAEAPTSPPSWRSWIAFCLGGPWMQPRSFYGGVMERGTGDDGLVPLTLHRARSCTQAPPTQGASGVQARNPLQVPGSSDAGRVGGGHTRSASPLHLLRAAVLWAVLGASLLAIARAIPVSTRSPILSEVLAAALALVGISLLVHFAALDALTAFWRTRGLDLPVPFHRPLTATSLRDFWSTRWNRPFAEMTTRIVARPLRPIVGRRPALFAGFLFSGLLHEMAMSFPVGGGYGLPTAYFALQGALRMIEPASPRDGMRRHLLRRRTWTLIGVLAPLPLLFHPPFLRGVIWPLVGR